MGYDVTFHPVGIGELQYYVFDVMNDPALAAQRAAELGSQPERHRMAVEAYRVLERYGDWSQWSGEIHFASVVAYHAAAIAGFLHPFWYSRNGSIALIGQYDGFVLGELFTSLTKIARGKASQMPDASHGILGLNCTGSGFIEPGRLPELLTKLTELAMTPLPPEAGPESDGLSVLDGVFDYDGLASLLGSIHYAADHGLGLMEASGIVVVLADQTVSDPQNFRENDPDERDRLLSELWPEFNEDWRPRRLR